MLKDARFARRFGSLLLGIGAIALLALPMAQASAASARTVDIVGDGDMGEAGAPFYFKQGRITVHQGDSVIWRNATDEPHSISVVDKADLPSSVADMMSCSVCEQYGMAHAPSMDANGPVPPFVASLDGFKVSAASPARLDGLGDSIVVAEAGKSYPSTLGGTITDTVSAAITAPAGTTLTYFCALHPWMQGTIDVLPANRK
jgi:plastocyanin